MTVVEWSDNIKASVLKQVFLIKSEVKMPKKPKFTRQEIIDAAYEIVKERGMEDLVARSLANSPPLPAPAMASGDRRCARRLLLKSYSSRSLVNKSSRNKKNRSTDEQYYGFFRVFLLDTTFLSRF